MASTTTDSPPRSNNNVTERGLNLEQVFIQKAHPPYSVAISPDKRRLKLTPLSKKACLIHGIDPTVLQHREYSSFSEPGLDPEIQTMRFEMYSRTREKLMQVASIERSKLVAKAHVINDSFSTNDSISMVSKVSSLEDQREKISTLIQNEKRRLEKVANRQKKELIRMLAFESKSQEILNKMRSKAEEQERKEFERKKEKRKRDMQAAEESRLRELRRKAKEDAEMGIQRLQMQEQFERDREIQREKERKEKEMKRRAKLEEK